MGRSWEGVRAATARDFGEVRDVVSREEARVRGSYRVQVVV